jgi:hypothetical protein
VLALGAAGFSIAAMSGAFGPERVGVTLVLLLLAAPLLAIWAWVRWRTRSYALLVSGLRWGDGVRFAVAPRAGRVIGIHLGGWIMVGLLLLAAAFALGMGLGMFAISGLDVEAIERTVTGGTAASPYILAATGLLAYLAFFLLRGTFRLAFVTYPLIRHVGDTLAVSGAFEVARARPGARGRMADADGFANLFDFGSGI